MEKFRHGRVIFAGDSAHQVSPFGARGANSGLQDTDNLIWKLKLVLDGVADQSLLDSYDAERLAAADSDVPGLNLGALANQNGLFAVLPLSKAQIASLREDHGIYMAGSGRINVAGLHEGNTPKFIAALADVTGG